MSDIRGRLLSHTCSVYCAETVHAAEALLHPAVKKAEVVSGYFDTGVAGETCRIRDARRAEVDGDTWRVRLEGEIAAMGARPLEVDFTAPWLIFFDTLDFQKPPSRWTRIRTWFRREREDDYG